jgi:hypothetical protein
MSVEAPPLVGWVLVSWYVSTWRHHDKDLVPVGRHRSDRLTTLRVSERQIDG